LAKWPTPPKAIFDLHSAGKLRALQRRLGATFMPWSDRNWHRSMDLFGADPLPYGLNEANRRTIETLCRSLFEQRLTDRRIDNIETLFASGSSFWQGSKGSRIQKPSRGYCPNYDVRGSPALAAFRG
jgi:hypothetical protein